LKGDLQAALERTDLERADALLEQILAAQDRELARRALEAAATCATRGQVAMTRLRYREAADHFGAAAARIPASHEAELRDILNRQPRLCTSKATNLVTTMRCGQRLKLLKCF
jgi:hypothetical protein